jgi:acyl carrier protein
MDLEMFIEKFAEQFDETDVSVFKPDTEFKSIDEWGSMMALLIIGMAGEEYGVTISDKDLEKSTTILDLFNITKSYVGE